MASYRYERDIDPKDLQPRKQRQYTRKERWANWWDYNLKWVIIIGIIVAVYMLASRKRFVQQAKLVLYSIFKPRWAQLIQEEVLYADRMFGGFINGKILDSAIIGVLCYFACIVFKFPSALLVSVIIGVTNVIPFFGPFIGAIPGAGGDIAVFVSYGASKSASKHPELYGTGIPNGVAATESANNGCSGGAMIPLLSLGVPGDSVTAILLGAFIMKGITPGPMMYVTELPTVYRVFAALMLANLCMLVVGCLGVRFFAKIVSVEKKMLYPIILVISLLGAFSINKNAFDVGVCVAFGIIGWLMNKYEFPLSPILLALILGPMCEKNFVRYMNIQRGNFFAITTSPIAMVFASVAILVIIYSVYNQSKINKRTAANAAQEKA